MAQKAVIMCAEHKETFRMLCIGCDHQYVCTKCIATKHQGHNFIDTENYFQVKRANFEHLLKKADIKIEDIRKEVHTIKKYRSGNKNNKDKAICDIKMKGDEIKSMVDEWVDKNVKTSEKIYCENEESINSFEKYLTDLLENLQLTVKSCRTISSSSQEFYSMEEELQLQTETPHRMEPNFKHVELVQHKFTPFNMWDFLGSLNVKKMQLFVDVETKQQIQACEIDRRLLSVSKELGSYRHTRVCKGTYSGSPCIIKTHKGQDRTVETESFLQEAMLLRTLHHPKVIQLIGFCASSPVCFVTEYMSRGNLSEYLSSHEKTLLLSDLMNFAAQIAEGMAYISSQRILHRNLRAANILVNGADEVKISDFSLAVRLEEDSTTWSAKGKYDNTFLQMKYTAPEAIQQGIFSTQTDIWSFGTVLWEIMSFGDLPFKGIAISEVVDNMAGNYPLCRPQICPETIYNEVMVECWKFSPEERPAFSLIEIMLKKIKLNHQGSPTGTEDVSTPTLPKHTSKALNQITTFLKAVVKRK